jgi:hypothetical protein
MRRETHRVVTQAVNVSHPPKHETQFRIITNLWSQQILCDDPEVQLFTSTVVGLFYSVFHICHQGEAQSDAAVFCSAIHIRQTGSRRYQFPATSIDWRRESNLLQCGFF